MRIYVFLNHRNETCSQSPPTHTHTHTFGKKQNKVVCLSLTARLTHDAERRRRQQQQRWDRRLQWMDGGGGGAGYLEGDPNGQIEEDQEDDEEETDEQCLPPLRWDSFVTAVKQIAAHADAAFSPAASHAPTTQRSGGGGVGSGGSVHARLENRPPELGPSGGGAQNPGGGGGGKRVLSRAAIAAAAAAAASSSALRTAKEELVARFGLHPHIATSASQR